MNKLAAARSEFGRRNMLYGYVFTYVRLLSGLFGESEGDESDHDSETDDSEDEEDALFRDLAEAAEADDASVDEGVDFSNTPGEFEVHKIAE